MMKKQTKNLIDRKWISDQLISTSNTLLYGDLMLLPLFLPIFIVATVGVIHSLIYIKNGIFLKASLVLIFLAPMIYVVNGIYIDDIRDFKKRKKIKNGDFDVAVCEILSKRIVGKCIYWPGRTKYREERLLTFAGFGEIRVSNHHYDYYSEGDEFYIVYCKSNNEVLSIYPLNAYEYISEAGQ